MSHVARSSSASRDARTTRAREEGREHGMVSRAKTGCHGRAGQANLVATPSILPLCSDGIRGEHVVLRRSYPSFQREMLFLLLLLPPLLPLPLPLLLLRHPGR